MKTDCTVIAKVVKNARLGTIRILFSFDTHGRITVQNAIRKTGDLCAVRDENRDAYIAKACADAQQDLNCNNVRIMSNLR